MLTDMSWSVGMTDNVTVKTKALKKKFSLSFQNDGILDIFVGWAIVTIGLFWETRATMFAFLGWMPLLLVDSLKNRIVIPRLGYAKFKKPKSLPLPVLIGTGIVLMTGLFFLAFSSRTRGFLGPVSPITVAVIGLNLMILLATGLNRNTFYASFIPLFFVVGIGLKFLTSTSMILIGGVLMLFGISLFVTFLRKYPLVTDGEKHG